MDRRHAGTPFSDQVVGWIEAHPWPERALVTLHTEVLDQHVWVDQRDGAWQVTGLIDFADGRDGHPVYEIGGLVELLLRGEPGGLAAFFEGYGRPWPVVEDPDEAPRQLLAAYFVHRFGFLPRLLQATPGPAPETLDALAARMFAVT